MKRRRPRRTGKPGREVGLDVHEYQKVTRVLRGVRQVLPLDELMEGKYLDQIDVIWMRMSEVDRKEVLYRMGSSRGR